MRKAEERVLPAAVYDTLELSALAFGGIGAHWLFDTQNASDAPFCVFGHAGFATNRPEFSNPIATALDKIFDLDAVTANNDAVVRINNRKRIPVESARVSFAEWCKELNIVRGN
jgi:hypothetical protein